MVRINIAYFIIKILVFTLILWYFYFQVLILSTTASLWPNESYFLFSNLEDNPISCVHSVEALHGGGWVLPNSNPCNSTTSPIQCTNVTTDGPTNITLQRVAEDLNDIGLVYKCCLPYDCSDSKTDVIIANIYSK